MSNKKCCGTCKYNCYDYSPNQYYCGNAQSEMAGALTDYNDTCDEWADKEQRGVKP